VTIAGSLVRALAATLLVAALIPSSRAIAADPAAAAPAGESASEAVTTHADVAAPKPLTGDSTLAEWKAASPGERNAVAVALARNRLAPDAPKLDIATMAMEITGCLSRTADDTRVTGWKVAPTATTCLTAPEREKK